MATYYVKATGTSDWPFDSEATAASNLDVLFAALTAHSAPLSDTDTIEARGEIFIPNGDYDLGGALLTGTDSRNDRLVLVDGTIFGGAIHNLNIAITSAAGSYFGGTILEYKNCRIGFENPGVVGSFIAFIAIALNDSDVLNWINNIFYCTNKQSGDFVIPGIVDIWAQTPASFIVESNTFYNLDGWELGFPIVAYLDELYYKNNVSNGGVDFFDISGQGIISDLQHENNCYLANPQNGESDDIALDISEVVADPLFIGTGDEPCRLQSASPARHTGFHFSESPDEDIVGTIRLNPPSMGALEDMTTREPNTFFVNRGSLTTDGLTPETGYHNISDLQQNIILIDDDVIEIVDNGVCDDSIVGEVIFNTSVTIVRYYMSSNIPTWKIAPGDSVVFATPGKQVHIYEINFLSDNFGKVCINPLLDLENSEISRCVFNNVQIHVLESSLS